MRLPAALLVAALVAAGCVGGAPKETPLEDLAIDPETPQDPAPTDEAPPASEPARDPAPTNPSPTPTTEPDPPTPPVAPESVPVPTPWRLNATFRLGYVAAAGAGGDVPTQGQRDAAHCPEGAFTMPAGARLLRVEVAGEAANADPSAPSAGSYRVNLTGPDGAFTALQPAMGPAVPGDRSADVDVPAAGAWGIRAEPVGPAVQQVWTVELLVDGESFFPPTDLAAAPACG